MRTEEREVERLILLVLQLNNSSSWPHGDWVPHIVQTPPPGSVNAERDRRKSSLVCLHQMSLRGEL